MNGLFVDEHSHQLDRSIMNESWFKFHVDLTATDPFFYTCIPFTNVKDISCQKKCFMCMAEGRKKATSVYCGLCKILSLRETYRHPSLHAYCMGVK